MLDAYCNVTDEQGKKLILAPSCLLQEKPRSLYSLPFPFLKCPPFYIP